MRGSASLVMVFKVYWAGPFKAAFFSRVVLSLHDCPCFGIASEMLCHACCQEIGFRMGLL
jgi:hypothetical protein